MSETTVDAAWIWEEDELRSLPARKSCQHQQNLASEEWVAQPQDCIALPGATEHWRGNTYSEVENMKKGVVSR